MADVTIMSVRIPSHEHKMLRKLAYLKEVSLNGLIVSAIKKSIQDEKKLLSNADVVVS